ncbi:transcriptional regulator [Streptomyces crystallinus]|uniref:XRE family transcriptional regulator n=1 Tax=Streptomyces crystallinus TaxID=68191 RepID=A0ABP3RTC9_9ACTN
MSDACGLDATLDRVRALIEELERRPEDVLDAAELSYTSGVPLGDVRELLAGRRVADPGVAARVQQRLGLLIETRRRCGDGVVRPLGEAVAAHTQAEIAQGIGVTPQALRAYRKPDHPAVPSVHTVLGISEWFRVHSGWLTEPADRALARVLRERLQELERQSAEREMERLLDDRGVRAHAFRAVGALSRQKLEALMTLLGSDPDGSGPGGPAGSAGASGAPSPGL